MEIVGGTTKCARVFSEYLQTSPGWVAQQAVLELGSGTGLVGLTAALLNPRLPVYLTDQAPMLPTTRFNVERNARTLVEETSCSVNVATIALYW